MDFVDLDKVLDEFEEEEKAANCINPGQEIRPSGYAEFIESHQDQPWESLSCVPAVVKSVVFTDNTKSSTSVMYDYSMPYEVASQPTVTDVGKLADFKPVSSSSEYTQTTHSMLVNQDCGESHVLQNENFINTKPVTFNQNLKENDSHPPSYSITYDENTNGSVYTVMNSPYFQHNGSLSPEHAKTQKKSIKASQVTAVQTDALTPRTERELDSMQFPKTGIIVEGHDQNDVHVLRISPESIPNSSETSDQHSSNENELKDSPYANTQLHVDHCDDQQMETLQTLSDTCDKSEQKDLSTETDCYSVSNVTHEPVLNEETFTSMQSFSDEKNIASCNITEMSSEEKTHTDVVGFSDGDVNISDKEVLEYLADEDNVDATDGVPTAELCNMERNTNNKEDPDIVMDTDQTYSTLVDKEISYVNDNTTVQSMLMESDKDNIEESATKDKTSETVNVSSNDRSFTEDGKIASDSGFETNDTSESKISMQDQSESKIPKSESEILSTDKKCDNVQDKNQFDSVQSDMDLTINSQVTGAGARPKEPMLKRNRPNSLLGLSKINLDSPFNLTQTVPERTDSGGNRDSLGVSKTGMSNADGGQTSILYNEVSSEDLISKGQGKKWISPQQKKMINLEIKQQLVQEQKQRMENYGSSLEQDGYSALDSGFPGQSATNVSDTECGLGILPGPIDIQPSGVSSEKSLISDMKDILTVGDSDDNSSLDVQGQDDMAILRRSEDMSASMKATNFSDASRPHSWSPGGIEQSMVPQKMKRPTSLNLPQRQDFSLSADKSPENAVDKQRRIGMVPPSEIPEENESSDTVADETSTGEENQNVGDNAEAVVAESRPHAIIQPNLGKVRPTWVPDSEAPNCMQCQCKFTFTKRRHHCRACGKVFCSSCCNTKSHLFYLDMKEARVCQSCYQMLQTADPSCHTDLPSPNPNNPSEYCSTIPPSQQASLRAPLPMVLVPTLKRQGTQRRAEPKQVMFSDGIRPGGDLTELDGSAEARVAPRRIGRVQKKVEKGHGGHSSPKARHVKQSETHRRPCFIPAEGLPPLCITSENGDYHMEENPDPKSFMPQIKDEEAKPVIFAINRNLFVLVKMLSLDCCVNRQCWCFTTKGMCTAGQDEIVIVLEVEPDEDSPPKDIFFHFHTVYEEANKGNTVSDMGHSIFNQTFLDSREHGGFLYLRPTFQCLQKIILPQPPYVFGILLQKWETPWAKVFPVRLLLRLGAEHRYYPCPLVSIRNRKPVFFEIGHTIMNLLADFRNYQYMLPQIRGVHIHMEDKKTIIKFPRNRYDELMKMVNGSNEHVMALGASFSPDADSHLVCIQNDEGNYQTQAINIQNKPRKITGASFVVFNGALKTTAGLRAKSSIVEDGLMVQILPECMAEVKQAIKDMQDYTIGCGTVSSDKPEEVVLIQWVEDDKAVNVGVKSPIDNKLMDGIKSIHIHNSTDYVGDNRLIRWTEVFFIQNEDAGSRWEPVDLSRLAETLASATCIAITSHLDQLKEASMTRIGLRVIIDTERVEYEIGANGEKLPDFYMNDLDNALIPVIHNAASQSQEGPIALELIFYILE